MPSTSILADDEIRLIKVKRGGKVGYITEVNMVINYASDYLLDHHLHHVKCECMRLLGDPRGVVVTRGDFSKTEVRLYNDNFYGSFHDTKIRVRIGKAKYIREINTILAGCLSKFVKRGMRYNGTAYPAALLGAGKSKKAIAIAREEERGFMYRIEKKLREATWRNYVSERVKARRR